MANSGLRIYSIRNEYNQKSPAMSALHGDLAQQPAGLPEATGAEAEQPALT